MKEAAKKKADLAIAEYKSAKQGKDTAKIEHYKNEAKKEIETTMRYGKDLDFSRKDKEIVLASLFKHFISLVNQIEEDVKHG